MFGPEAVKGVHMPADLTARNIRTVDQYLELMARAIFASGLSWAVVDKRWSKIRRAFGGFSAVATAGLTDADLIEVLDTPGVIGNQGKVEAVREAAQVLLARRSEFGSVGRWLDALEDFAAQAKALRKARFIGPFGAYYVLSVAGFEVPDYQTWLDEYARGMRAG
jgi:3-methyladenine DNA glycosylase Tag